MTAVKEGDRVGVTWLYSAYGYCEYCLSVWETVCAEAKFGVCTKHDGFAEYILAGADYVTRTGEFSTPLFNVAANCITIRGSFVGTRQDMSEGLAFAADVKVKADIERQPLSAINKVLTGLKQGRVASRVLIDFAANAGMHI